MQYTKFNICGFFDVIARNIYCQRFHTHTHTYIYSICMYACMSNQRRKLIIPDGHVIPEETRVCVQCTPWGRHCSSTHAVLTYYCRLLFRRHLLPLRSLHPEAHLRTLIIDNSTFIAQRRLAIPLFHGTGSVGLPQTVLWLW